MTDARLEALAARYKATVASRYRALKLADLHQIPNAPCCASPKIDGELWLAELHQGHAQLFARGGRSITQGPLHAALAQLASSCQQPIMLAGELHTPGTPERRPRVGDVVAALADGDHSALRFSVFDVVALNGEPAAVAYAERLRLLRDLLGKQQSAVQLVETECLPDTSRLKELTQQWVASGAAEGLVVRSELTGEIYKLKPSLSLDAVVVGFTVRADTPQQVRSLLLGLCRSDGSIQLIGACGNVPGDSLRQQLLEQLEPLECGSAFRHSSSDGNLYRFVRPELVVEISCTDLQMEDADSAPVRRWALQYSEEGWSGLVDLPSVSLIHPVMARTRPDKTADGVDVRLAQLQELLPDLDFETPAQPRELPASELIRRQVWSKSGKGGMAVRKLLVWSSGKENSWPGWPAWLIHFTDYSPDRKTPLERTLRTARDQQEAMAVADALVEANIKKGWEEVTTPPSASPTKPRETKTGATQGKPAKKAASRSRKPQP